MSWLGDSLTSLKGQITKITKEVLADDESADVLSDSPNSASFKKLESLCEAKDLKIASLNKKIDDIINQYESEIKILKHKNEEYQNNICINEVNTQYVNELKKELKRLSDEREHLNVCIDELQSEHQANIDEVIAMKNKYKTELEQLKSEFHITKSKLEEMVKPKQSDEESLELEKTNDSVVNLLKTEIQMLKVQLEKNSNKDMVENLRKDIETLTSENEYLRENQVKADENIVKLKLENDSLIKKLVLIEGERHVTESELNSSALKWPDVYSKLFDILKNYSIVSDKTSVIISNSNIEDTINLLEKEIYDFNQNRREEMEKVRFQCEILESELNKMNTKNNFLESEIQSLTSKLNEKRCQLDSTVYQSNLEEIKNLKLKIIELEKQKNVYNQGQTDDVKRLEQEMNKLLTVCDRKKEEIQKLALFKEDLAQELLSLEDVSNNVKHQLICNEERKKLQENALDLKNKEAELKGNSIDLHRQLETIKSENVYLSNLNTELKFDIESLQKELNDIRNVELLDLQKEHHIAQHTIAQLQKTCSDLEKINVITKNEIENLKASIIIKEAFISDLTKYKEASDKTINELKIKIDALNDSEKELVQCKNISVDLEMQRQELVSKIELLENENLKLKSDLQLLGVKDTEILQLKQSNTTLIDSCNRLHHELESKFHLEQVYVAKENDLLEKLQEQRNCVVELQDEKNKLLLRVHRFQEQLKSHIGTVQCQEIVKQNATGHQRCRSDGDSGYDLGTKLVEKRDVHEVTIKMLKEAIQQEQTKTRELYSQLQIVTEREGNARREFERLKQHLITVEDHYTEESIANEKVINELKSKFMAAEEQLKNSSTLYTSTKIRDNQHLESLQSQIKLVSAQRDDFQAKLSVTEDEIQKHKASLLSLQIVLEQFQQDKEREIEELAGKNKKQMEINDLHLKEAKMEILNLQKQLSEAKNGLKAASRLGEELENKTQEVSALNKNVNVLKMRVEELEENLKKLNLTASTKVEKSLIKNLVMGYILSPVGDRRSQVLRILASVLDFDEMEREKMKVDSTGWLNNLIHPKSGGTSSNESLSQAFIKFLESESRPQPQMKLLTEQHDIRKSNHSISSPKSSGILSDLMLPTFSSSQESDSSVILEDILKDS